jgi:hypothetical protein
MRDLSWRTTMAAARGGKISLDWWAVIAALAAVALVRSGLVPNVPW